MAGRYVVPTVKDTRLEVSRSEREPQTEWSWRGPPTVAPPEHQGRRRVGTTRGSFLGSGSI